MGVRNMTTIIVIILLSLSTLLLGLKCLKWRIAALVMTTAFQQRENELPSDAEMERAKSFVTKNIVNDLLHKN